jgi:hypothetical protein
MEGTGPLIERFGSLLRDLVRWGLVERHETKARRSWLLAPAAQRRLDELVPAHAPVEADVYLDRVCADCRLRRLTRRKGDSYLCEDCWVARQSRKGGLAESPPQVRQSYSRRRLRPADDHAPNGASEDTDRIRAMP